MNHKRYHDDIISRAGGRGQGTRHRLKQVKKQLEGYFEIHHVTPRSLGGSDSPENLVLLTAKEHFVVHALLCHMHPGNEELLYAFNKMRTAKTKSQERYFSGSSYAKIQEKFSDLITLKNVGNKHAGGVKRSDEQKQLLSRIHKGKKLSPEQLEIVKGNLLREHTEETKAKIGAAHRGKKYSEETRRKISESKKAANALRRAALASNQPSSSDDPEAEG